MRAPTFATLLLSALILGTASHVQAQGHRHTAPGHRFHDHAPGHAKRWDDIDRRDKRVRWEDRYDRDDRRLPWYVKREPVRARRDYAFERYLWEHRALHERLERMHLQWHRAHDRGRRDRHWHSKHAALHARLRQQHAHWHARVGRRHDHWDERAFARLAGSHFPGHFALADLGGVIATSILLDHVSR